jgi:phosphoribosylamine--glycine ligase
MEFDKIVSFAKTQKTDLVVVAPDDPLAAGACRPFGGKRYTGLRTLQGRRPSGRQQGLCKRFMKKYKIPTADYRVFDNPKDALDYLDDCSFPWW